MDFRGRSPAPPARCTARSLTALPKLREKSAAARPAMLPLPIAQVMFGPAPPVKPPQLSSRVAASPAAYRPGTVVPHSSLAMRTPPVPRTVPSSRRVICQRCSNGSIPTLSKAAKKFGCIRRSIWRVSCLSVPLSSLQYTGALSSSLAMAEVER